MNSHGSIVAVLGGAAIIWVVLLDAFETVVLPRRVRRHLRLTAVFYRRTWIPWRGIARRIKTVSRQQNFLGYFGPLSLILLLAFWATGLIFGFALIQRGIGGQVQASLVVADAAGLLGGEDHFGAGKAAEDLVRADRVQRGEPVVEHDGNLHDSPRGELGRGGNGGGTRPG